MSQYDPNLDPNVEINRIPPTQPVYTETIETVVVRPESNTGWWVAGILSAIVLIALFWVLASGGNDDDTEMELARAQAEAAQANANADQVHRFANHLRGIDREPVAQPDEERPQQQVPAVFGEVRIELEERSHRSGTELPTFAPPARNSNASEALRR